MDIISRYLCRTGQRTLLVLDLRSFIQNRKLENVENIPGVVLEFICTVRIFFTGEDKGLVPTTTNNQQRARTPLTPSQPPLSSRRLWQRAV